ncbi:membrane protein YdbS with pleckstrin-like domain [Cupriavidus metallidurans]|jgi:hypothetical protein|uniref:hypothetical protein n=2 Tax=Burkholderiaceae TaxID=119060 RepID=UPI0004935339|nr:MULTISPECIES: hypothetical protein [Cupriavidus]AVA38095.1 hypothetical protein C3Z06_31330 [Cupriavidus metallidurans]MCA3184287.1 hypothetical protein [Cupriavidus sp.]MCA3188630.1 hypothetical protein [Cupriavidus sp.]MCA3234679.1 hypothetical protein [Cupriavidus sp.]MDE4922656.1 hypothetical protein [Cupriavidus metallidurans]
MVRELNKIPTLAWWIAEVILCVAVYCLLEGQAIIFGSLPTWVAAASIAGFVTIVAVLVLTKQYKYVYMPFLLVGGLCIQIGAADALSVPATAAGTIAMPTPAQLGSVIAWAMSAILVLGAIASVAAYPMLLSSPKRSSPTKRNAMTHTEPTNAVTLPAADLEHITKFIGTGPGKDVPSPVEMVKRGVLPLAYLDRFGQDSTYHVEIDAYKKGTI